MNPYCIVNPKSANGATRKRFQSVEGALRSAFPGLTVAYTEGPMHAATLAADAAARGEEMVVACGGDGTLNEVTQSIAGSGADTILAVMPSGTGGDFKRMLGLGSEPEAVVGYLQSGWPKTVDTGVLEYVDNAGTVGKRAFINIASCGISGLVDHYVNNTSKALGGKASFFLGSLRGMLGYENVRVTVRVDGEAFYEGRANLVAAANGRYFGGGMMVAPAASLDDGLLDVVVFGDLTRMEFVGLSNKIYSGSHLSHPKISHCRGKVVEVETGEPAEGPFALIDMDGEQVGRAPLKARVLPASLRLLFPA